MKTMGKEFKENVPVKDKLRILLRSEKKDERGKPVKEIKVYADNKVPGMQARYDKARIAGVTKVFQTVWKKINGRLKLVHAHWKK